MSLVLAVHTKSNIYEYFLPGLNNRKVSVDIPSDATGYGFDLAIALEVWKGVWQINETDALSFIEAHGQKDKVLLEKGLALVCLHKPSGERISIVVDENYEGYSDFDKYILQRGDYTIGRDKENVIQYDSRNLVSGRHATLTVNPGGTSVITDSSLNGTFVNGMRITGARKLDFGDVVYIIGLKIVCLGEVFAINRPADRARFDGLIPYSPPPEEISAGGPRIADVYYQRSPRQIEELDDETIEIEAPPDPNRSSKQPLIFTIGPAMTMIIPMAAGVLFTMWSAQQAGGMTSPFMFMGIITSVTAAFIGVFWALANYRYRNNTEKREEARRSELYRAYLEKIRELLMSKHSDNKAVLDKKYPDAGDCLGYADTVSRRLWERNVNHLDFLTVRLGRGEMPSPNEISIPKERFSLVDDSLAEEPLVIKTEFAKLKNVPVCISLREHNLIGVIGGSQEACNRIAQLLAVQIAAYHSYSDVRLAFVYNEKEARDFELFKWLPHTWKGDGSLRMMACDAAGVGELFYDLSSLLRGREERENQAPAGRPLPHYVVFISDPALVENEAIMKYLSAPAGQMGLTTVMLYGQIDRLPNNCTVIIQNDGEYKGYYSLDNSFAGFENVDFDLIENERLELFARSLSDIRIREAYIAGAPPQLLTFLDMYKTSDVRGIDVQRRWLENRTYESMKAMIGYRGADTPLYLDIHEKYHGPHGLVAGTTGSGKSETLQTYILSLAMSYHPYEVSFILIDYKGGGMAGSFEKLPHIAGIITNLGGNQTNRALASINSEIKRRQAVFNEYKLKHIDGYIELYRAGKTEMPIPHLLIIADEFAELKKEQPEFVRELVSASRVGRSLGVHLILATQKPAGVIDDEIWGNSKFRLCLRVQDRQDSNEMIKRPDAAYITNAGRGYFQVGSDEIFELFQSGWSGAKYTPEIPFSDARQGEVKMINLWGKPIVVGGAGKDAPQPEGEEKQTQLEAAVLHVARTAESLGVKAIDNIWLPPLPKQISLQDIGEFTRRAYNDGAWRGATGELNPVVGIVDDPVNQRQSTVSIDMLTEGHLIVTGSGSSGKTTFLQTLLYSLTATYSPKQLFIYIADFGSRTMGLFGALPHVGGVVYDNETDKADKLVALLMNELARRKLAFSEKGIGSIKEYVRLYDDVPFIVFAIDNYAAWSENCAKQEENLVQLSREAASYGIFLVFTCTNSGDIRNKIRQNISCGVGLQLADRFEYEEAIGEKTYIVAEDRTPGRGLICFPKPLEFQTALCLEEGDAVSLNMRLKEQFEDMSRAWTGPAPPVIPQVPEDMSLDSLMRLDGFAGRLRSGRYMPFAYDLAEARVECVDFAKTFCYSISGAARSGKTNMLKVFIRLAKEQGSKVYVFDGAARELELFSRESEADRYIASAGELFDFMQDIIIPEFTSRNKKKADFVRMGRKNVDEYMASMQRIVLFINDMTAFCEAVYESERDMKGFIEQMVARGDGHMICLFACIAQADMTGEYSSKRFLRGFIGWKDGLHLGGKLEDQKVFDFDVPVLERGKKLPAGYGHAVVDGVTKRIVTPMVV